jgi:hypothetical protein
MYVSVNYALAIIASCWKSSSGSLAITELTHPKVRIIFSMNSGSVIYFASSIFGF